MTETRFRHFLPAVLDRYEREREKYIVEDTVGDGTVRTSSPYLATLGGRARRASYVFVRYDRRKTLDGAPTIRPWPLDFERLPAKHRLHWLSWEITRPTLTPLSADLDFLRWAEQNYGGQFIVANDPLLNIPEQVSFIAINFGIYLWEASSALKYPHLNNRISYSESHNELRKLVGPDNMVVASLKGHLQSLGIEFDEKDRSWSLFKGLVHGVGGDDVARILSPLEKCNKERSLVAHEILEEPQLTEDNFIDMFRSDCAGVVDALDRLALRLRWAINSNPKEKRNA
jgi:hypothetical protein